ncbi:MAG: PDZ domain-containing protein [Deltaproteobacteria bacterium]|nr:PDZ domain-containing protein [Deltaproteobacteria bacterium]
MKLYVKLTILLGALASALYLTIQTPSSKSLKLFGAQETEAAPGRATPKPKHDLTALKIFNVTLVRLRDNYVDPTRIDTKEMLLKALDSVQRSVAEVLVEPRKAEDKVIVQVNDQKKTFELKDVDSPWRLATRLKEIFKFVQANMNPGSDAREIEYAAVNGMLSTLDPHSTLLDPESYKEMRVNTSQKFGGLGIVIGIRKDKLTVINPMPGTPASRAGILANDHIVKIDDEATVNLTLTEAVNRLRGDPDTNVTVWIERKGQPGPATDGGLLKFPLTRAEIHVDSVESQLLKNGVGYFKIKQFGATTSDELKKAMAALTKQGARAWILDLRWNPGGLLDQAIKMSDIFIEKGTLVTTVGYAGKQRDERRAVAAGTDTTSPVAVILNGGSASASEIVAGALKNNDRALIIGQTSFGKGSVQVLFDNDDESALKLTIAQYLTPGDISIQSVGVPPDIALLPARIPDKLGEVSERVRYLGPNHLTRESDLDSHLDHATAKKGERPAEEVAYLYVPPPKKAGAATPDDDDTDPGTGGDPEEEDEEEPPPDADKFVEDFEITFSRDFLTTTKSVSRKEMIAQARAFAAKRRAEEEVKIAAKLQTLGINWEKPLKVAGTPNLHAKWESDRPDGKLSAGETIKLKLTVTNDGTGPAFQVRGLVKNDDYTFDDVEMMFGRINPGETKTFEQAIKVPREAITRVDALRVELKDATGREVAGVPQYKVTLAGLARPVFGYKYQIIDDVRGNKDGLLQRGEEVRLLTAITNLGLGKAWKTLATLKNNSGDGVVVNKGRFDLGAIDPNAEKSVEFTFEVAKDFEGSEVQVEVMVYDQTLREFVTEKIDVPISQPEGGIVAAKGVARVGADTWVYEGARQGSMVIGRAAAGSSYKLLSRIGDGWLRVEVANGRPGFIATKSASVLATGAASPKFSARWAVTPPKLVLSVPLEADATSARLTGKATDDKQVEDAYIFVSNRGAKIDKKVFYTSNKNSKNGAELAIDATVPLWPGANVITVVAREDNEVQTRQTYIVYRPDGPATAARTK